MKNRIKTALFHSAMVAVTVAAAVAIGGRIPQLIAEWRGPVRNGDFAVHVDNQPQRLTLYGTTTCRHCINARQYLRQAGIAFNDEVIDASPSSLNMFAKLNEDGVPVLVSRTGLISGFSPAAYDKLAKASAQP